MTSFSFSLDWRATQPLIEKSSFITMWRLKDCFSYLDLYGFAKDIVKDTYIFNNYCSKDLFHELYLFHVILYTYSHFTQSHLTLSFFEFIRQHLYESIVDLLSYCFNKIAYIKIDAVINRYKKIQTRAFYSKSFFGSSFNGNKLVDGSD